MEPGFTFKAAFMWQRTIVDHWLYEVREAGKVDSSVLSICSI